jgi:hypothetical protein
MADFSALCPLFNTGMYSEIAFPGPVYTTARSTTNRSESLPPFSRSVIITHCYIRKNTTFVASSSNLKLAIVRAATWGATRTIFGTFNLSATAATQIRGKFLPFTIATAKTITATQIVQLKFLKKEGAGAKTVSVVVRYKEK